MENENVRCTCDGRPTISGLAVPSPVSQGLVIPGNEGPGCVAVLVLVGKGVQCGHGEVEVVGSSCRTEDRVGSD